MKKILNDDFFTMWEDYIFQMEKEPFMDVLTCGDITEMSVLQNLTNLVFITNKEANGEPVPQYPDTIREFTDTNGESYLVGSNSLQKLFKKSHLINTLSPKNEIVKTPHDANLIWFISPVVKTGNPVKND